LIVPALLLALVAGLLLGGRLGRLIDVRLQWVALLLGAVALRVGTQTAIAGGIEAADALRLPLFVSGFALLALATWLNRSQPGMLAITVGALANGTAVLLNGGWMPVWEPALAAVGLGVGDLNTAFHRPLPAELGLEFLLRGGVLADIIPIPLPFLANVASVGDAFIASGLAWFVLATMLRPPRGVEGSISLGPGRREQPLIVLDSVVILGGARRATFAPTVPLGARIRGHPYVRLSLDPRFAAFWLAQTISLFGDRLHQVALAVLVYGVTDSPLATGLVFLTAMLPNLLLGPVAGTFVDRWNHKKVLIVSDLLRAALVLTLPLATLVDVIWVYPIVFLITTVSLFFRPAKVAVVPRIVSKDDLLAANSATWTADTLADIAGFPVAGMLVAFLGADLVLAFVLDSATYVLSAVLLALIFIPPVVREAGPRVTGAIRGFLDELVEGFRFLTSRPPLIQNTLISAVAQTSVGVTLALAVVYARDWLDGSLIPYPENYAAIETAIGVGNLIGGLAVGAIGQRARKGWLVVAGFIVMGLATIAFGLTGNVALAVVAAVVIGVANLVYIIPTQTIFIELTPIEMMGRVVAFRSSLVFGSMLAAMGISGALAEFAPVGLVIAAFGVVTVLAGLVGALLPAVRDP
jgi:MFS transporter, DHA3 family, macrolide efflux protein